VVLCPTQHECYRGVAFSCGGIVYAGSMAWGVVADVGFHLVFLPVGEAQCLGVDRYLAVGGCTGGAEPVGGALEKVKVGGSILRKAQMARTSAWAMRSMLL
jgi:hypothetical protein